MKGIERSTLLYIIIILIILGLIGIIVFPVAGGFGGWGGSKIKFEEACFFWSYKYYSGTTAEDPSRGYTYDMTEFCMEQLGRVTPMPGCPDPTCFDVPEWDDCRDICRGMK